MKKHIIISVSLLAVIILGLSVWWYSRPTPRLQFVTFNTNTLELFTYFDDGSRKDFKTEIPSSRAYRIHSKGNEIYITPVSTVGKETAYVYTIEGGNITRPQTIPNFKTIQFDENTKDSPAILENSDQFKNCVSIAQTSRAVLCSANDSTLRLIKDNTLIPLQAPYRYYYLTYIPTSQTFYAAGAKEADPNDRVIQSFTIENDQMQIIETYPNSGIVGSILSKENGIHYTERNTQSLYETKPLTPQTLNSQYTLMPSEILVN